MKDHKSWCPHRQYWDAGEWDAQCLCDSVVPPATTFDGHAAEDCPKCDGIGMVDASISGDPWKWIENCPCGCH